MNIFITGGAGFIGANFIHTQFLGTHNHLLNFDKLTYAGNLTSLTALENEERYTFVHGDICDPDLVASTIQEFQPDAIVHFAAESHVDRSIEGPAEFIRTNILGTYTLLEQSLIYFRGLNNSQKQQFRFLHVSTDEVYGSLGATGLFTENTAYDPRSPYSASKASSDHLVTAWHHTFGLPILITNCSNNYGPYQFPEKLIPLMILNCLEHKPLPIYGTGENVRDWLYVEDHCNAINTVLHKGQPGQTYNIGGNNEMTNVQIVKTICKILNEIRPSEKLESYEELMTFVEDRPGHDLRYAIDAAKIQDELGWAPHENFQSGIVKTINWYLNNNDWWKRIQDQKYHQERLGMQK